MESIDVLEFVRVTSDDPGDADVPFNVVTVTFRGRVPPSRMANVGAILGKKLAFDSGGAYLQEEGS